MRNIIILTAMVLMALSSFTKKTAAMNDSQNRYDLITLDSIKWQLTRIYNADSFVQVSSPKAFIRFNTNDGKVTGHGSCNSFGGKLTIDGNNLKLDNIFSTKMFCNEVQTIENEFFGQLQKVTGYAINEKKLILFNGDHAVLEFEAG